MSKEELLKKQQEVLEKQDKLLKEIKNLEKEKAELKKAEKDIEIQLANENLEFLRDNVDVILQLIPEHSRNGCDDDNPDNDYFEHGEAYCKRCMLLSVLKGWRTCKVTWDVKFEDLED